MYASIDRLRDVAGAATVLDVPCGGGLSLRGLHRHQQMRFVVVDISDRMLARTRAKAAERGLDSIVETVAADMRALPFPDDFANLILSYSGLHMINDPRVAIGELARVLKSGGRLVGSLFVTDSSRRQRALFRAGARAGHAVPLGTGAEVAEWLRDAGLLDVRVQGRGFAQFSARCAAR